MGWFDWVAETAGKIRTAIRTGLRGVIDLPEEIEPYIPTRPATPAQIEDIVEELVYTERFIEEALPDEALRLARGVLTREPLRNVARVRQWTTLDPYDIPPSLDYQISVRGVLVAPDGKITHVDVAFPTNEAYSYDEFVRRAASSLEDDFVAEYDMGRSAMVRQFLAVSEPYIQTYVPL